ncbi:MAG: hypothetical protein LBU83_12070 [Bacteroidales bacterium]|nr:hypothetical protein [Bacteroidales bacterium]
MKKEIIKYIIVFFTLIGIYIIFSTAVSLLPTKIIKRNIEVSTKEMVKDGDYPCGIITKKQYQMDNFTDALILSQNFSINSNRPFHSALNPRFAHVPGTNLSNALKLQVELSDIHLIDYPRYWHGNTFLLRPFLLFTDYSVIRWVLYVISSLFLLVLGIKLYQTLGMIKTIAFFLGLLFVNIFITQFSIQFFISVNLSLIACILMCNHFNNRKKILLFSFIFGSLTAYLDLLTTPLLTCGLPLIVYLSAENEDSFKTRLSSLFRFAFLWGIGYSFTWVSKWTLGTIFTEKNVFRDAFDTVLFRTSSEDFSRFDSIISNFELLPVFFISLILILLFPLVVLFFNRKAIKTNLLLLIVATFPFLWFLFAAQHSWWHWWFTYRILAISIIAVFFIFINFISWNRINTMINRKK